MVDSGNGLGVRRAVTSAAQAATRSVTTARSASVAASVPAAPSSSATTSKAAVKGRGMTANTKKNTGGTSGKPGARPAAKKKQPSAKKTPRQTTPKAAATPTPGADRTSGQTREKGGGRGTVSQKAASKTVSRVAPKDLAVRPEESPWTTAELREVRQELEGEVGRLRGEIAAAELEIAGLLREVGEVTGDDQADAGSKTFEREHEMSLANNTRGMLLQAERALRRIDDGTYGICESCGNPIGKARLQVFPRATLCVTCKQRQERR